MLELPTMFIGAFLEACTAAIVEESTQTDKGSGCGVVVGVFGSRL